MHEMLWDGLKQLGLSPFVKNQQDRLITVNTIEVPKGVDWAAVVKNAMDKYQLEIAGGLGPTAGKVWRIGECAGGGLESPELLTSRPQAN
jgi:alanine-glyoxylate transaminase/serine-glyoxylate transaminase/serine-pyruvate transaminase